MSKREASMFAAQGVVDVDAPRAKRHKPALPSGAAVAGAGSSGNAKDDVAALNGREVKQEQIEAAAPVVVVNEDPEVVKEKGLKVWHAIKDAVNKEGRILSVDFMRLPSKRQYPDYYQQIKHPISLDEIKQQLDAGAYLSIEDCKSDLETCFKNAKRYNMRESQIWKDAKFLHKLVTKEIAKLAGVGDASHPPEDGEAAGGVGGSSDVDGENGGKKKKQPNMTRVLKARLQKLVDKSDEGRVLATEFMDLPNRKQWPVYYKTIKKPQCLENIFKKLKRKEYHTALDFANDVELVFSNALEFNQEHTPIWEDAIVLRDYFRQLMSDLPVPFAIAAYSSPDHSTKIKLRMPNASQQPSTTAMTNPNPTGGMLMLRVPPQGSPAALNVTTQLPNTNSINVNVKKSPKISTKVTPLVPEMVHPAPAAPAPSHPTHTPPSQSITLTPVATTSHVPPTTFAQPAYAAAYASAHYPNAVYQPPQSKTRTPTTATISLPHTNPVRPATRPQQQPLAPAPIQTQVLTLAPPTAAITSQPIAPRPAVTPIATTTTTAPLTGTATVQSKSPTPATASRQRKLQYVLVVTKPHGRKLELDAREGVKTWAVRLGTDEWNVHVSGVKFFPVEGEDEAGTSAEHDEGKAKEDKEDKMDIDLEARKEEEEEEEEQVANVKGSPKRGRGRPRKKPKQDTAAAKSAEPPSKVAAKGKANAKSVTPSPSSPAPSPGEVQVKLNGGVVRRLAERKDEWEVKLPVGYNVLEVGEKGGMVWRMYLERMGATAGGRFTE